MAQATNDRRSRMIPEVSTGYEGLRSEIRGFVDVEISPFADRFDREEKISADLPPKLFKNGYLGSFLPGRTRGLEFDMVVYGILNEEIGRGCSSVRSLLTVHDMTCLSILKWGTKEQKNVWLQRLTDGRQLAAFALAEVNAGSDINCIETEAVPKSDRFILRGEKKWITFGQLADVFLIFAKSEGKPAAFLLDRSAPGLSIKPISGLLGVRASMLATIQLEDCEVPKENLLGRVGAGLSHIASSALNLGRYGVACGCVGISQACLESSIRYANHRRQFGNLLKDFQLVQRMISDMAVHLKAARLLCMQAGRLLKEGSPDAIVEICAAKYFTSQTASKAATDAVQIHGANGCSGEFPVARYFRDAKIMEIIEGSTEMQQLLIASHVSMSM